MAAEVRSFKVEVHAGEILELERRLKETRWPAALEGAGWTLGMDDAFLRSLRSFWVERFDWRAIESDLNRLPHFRYITDAGCIHFVHLKSGLPGALPIILTHGWPSTFAELVKLGEMLADPIAFGAAASDAFDVVIPSLPGYIFSSPSATLGTNVFTIAGQWAALMSALGYPKFIAHGGDIGAGVSTALGLEHGERLAGLHLNFIPGSYQPYVPDPSDLSPEETGFFASRAAWLQEEGGYSHVQATKPDVLGPALNDSPVGLAAWIIDKFRSWSDCNGDVETRFTREDLLTTVSLYWFTRSMPSAVRLYWENRRRPLQFARGQRIEVPVGFAHFPRELPVPPRRYVERGYNITRWTEMPKGGHFAAMEEPQALAEDIREFARPLR